MIIWLWVIFLKPLRTFFKLYPITIKQKLAFVVKSIIFDLKNFFFTWNDTQLTNQLAFQRAYLQKQFGCQV